MEESGSFREIICRKMFPASQTKAEKMIKNIFIAFENRINNLAWMSPETK
jgi:endothelin-converting enzyme/putative endopeptidase